MRVWPDTTNTRSMILALNKLEDLLCSHIRKFDPKNHMLGFIMKIFRRWKPALNALVHVNVVFESETWCD